MKEIKYSFSSMEGIRKNDCILVSESGSNISYPIAYIVPSKYTRLSKEKTKILKEILKHLKG